MARWVAALLLLAGCDVAWIPDAPTALLAAALGRGLLVAASCAGTLPSFNQRAETTNGNVLAATIAGPPGDYMAIGMQQAPRSLVACKAADRR